MYIAYASHIIMNFRKRSRRTRRFVIGQYLLNPYKYRYSINKTVGVFTDLGFGRKCFIKAN